MEKNGIKVYVGLSGGVDSSVAAALLREQGYDVVAVHMQCWTADEKCATRDREDARRVAAKLGIPFMLWDFEEEYRQRVVDYMIDGYRRGITPNPDVMCNSEIKFGLFLDKAIEKGAQFVATGHYVRRIERNGDVSLGAGADTNKDQSYFLWALESSQITRALFPVGELTKPEVRELAKKYDLPTAEKKDSQGICFMGEISMEDFLLEHLDEEPGDVVTADGEKVGEHKGARLYTIGQRHGLGVYGGGGPYYVAEKDIAHNRLIVAQGEEDPALYKREVLLKNIVHHGPHMPDGGVEVLARVRYRQDLSPARLFASRDEGRLVFDEPVQYVAEGQSAVWYRNNEKDGLILLGGGIISSSK